MRRFVRENEQRVLLYANDEYRQNQPRARPDRDAERERERDKTGRQAHGKDGTQVVQLSQRREFARRKHTPCHGNANPRAP